MKRITTLGALLAATALTLSACGSSSDSSTPKAADTPTSAAASPSAPATSPSTSSSAMITIKDYKYATPDSVTAGEKITVKNEDSVAHTVTADDSSGGFDVKVDANATATFTAPSKAGSYKYHCTYHSNMHGTLKVS